MAKSPSVGCRHATRYGDTCPRCLEELLDKERRHGALLGRGAKTIDHLALSSMSKRIAALEQYITDEIPCECYYTGGLDQPRDLVLQEECERCRILRAQNERKEEPR